MMHHGMVVVGLPYAFQGQMGVEEVQGRLALWRLDDYRRRRFAAASAVELEAARFQGAHVRRIAAKLAD